jgi:hypothetical protein
MKKRLDESAVHGKRDKNAHKILVKVKNKL